MSHQQIRSFAELRALPRNTVLRYTDHLGINYAQWRRGAIIANRATLHNEITSNGVHSSQDFYEGDLERYQVEVASADEAQGRKFSYPER